MTNEIKFDLIEDFVNTKGYRANSIKLYKNTLRKYFRYCAKMGIPIFEMQRADIIKFIESPLNDGKFGEKKRKTKKTYKTVISGFYDWSIQNNNILSNPILKYKIKSGGKKQAHRVIDDIDFSNMLNHCENLKETTIISLLWYTGVRSIELRELKVNDVNFHENNIEVNYSKTTMGYRKIPIHPNFRELLKLYLKVRNSVDIDQPYLFLSNRKTQYSERSIL